ncbi:MAG: DUF1569 domain-containing protein [Flavobacterium sp.]
MRKVIFTFAIALFSIIGTNAQTEKGGTPEISNNANKQTYTNTDTTSTHGKVKLKRNIINKHLLKSTFPILFATVKQPFVKGIKGKDFFSEKMLQTLTKRVNSLTPQSQRKWGTMSPEQMLHHLNLATGSALGYFDLPDESFWMSRTVFKFLLVDVLSKQPKGLRIPLTFKIPQTEHFDFEHEKKLLLEIINKACNSKTTADWGPHPLFGKMSDKEWGRLLTVHIDYHLKQFGV